jgi:integrase
MAEFTLATGLRESNVTHLEWNQVNLQRKVAWVNADQAKGRKSIGVPLNSSAVRVLLTLRGNHSERVFTYQGRPINKANTKAWRCALKRAGIKDFRWHDLRHTWASWHIQNGTQLSVLKELGGWSDIRMVLKYAHLSPEHLASHAENICVKEVSINNIARFPAHLTNQLGGS